MIFLGTKGENGSVEIDPESGRAFLLVVDDKIWGVWNAKTCILLFLSTAIIRFQLEVPHFSRILWERREEREGDARE